MFYIHQIEVLLIIGLLFTGIGYVIGWSLWGQRRKEADMMEALNGTLKTKRETLSGDQEKLAKILKDLSSN